MARPSSRHPTDLELEILKTVWRNGPSSGRQVSDALAGTRQLAHTSVLTVMNIMVKKGYLRRTKPGGTYLYEAIISEQATLRRMLGDLVERAFDGSAAAVMLHLLETADMDPDELKAVRQLISRKVKEKSS